MSWRGKLANIIGPIGLGVMIFGMILGPSPDDYLDVWMIAAGGCLMALGFAIDDGKVR